MAERAPEIINMSNVYNPYKCLTCVPRDELKHIRLYDDLSRAAYCGQLEEVKRLIDQLKMLPKDSWEILASAAAGDQMHVAKWFIEYGVKYLEKALSGAAAKGRLEMVQWLISQGAKDIDHALMMASGNDQNTVAEYLTSLMNIKQCIG